MEPHDSGEVIDDRWQLEGRMPTPNNDLVVFDEN
jgi:hypothetical protein